MFRMDYIDIVFLESFFRHRSLVYSQKKFLGIVVSYEHIWGAMYEFIRPNLNFQKLQSTFPQNKRKKKKKKKKTPTKNEVTFHVWNIKFRIFC